MNRNNYIFLLCTLVLLGTNAFAQFTWNNVGGTNIWDQDDNWDAVAQPTGLDAVIFDGAVSNDNCVISNGVAAECFTVTIRNNYTGTIEIEGGGSLNIANDGTTTTGFVINATGFSGTLLINNTGILTVNGIFSVNATGNSGATYTINGELYTGGLAVPTGTFNAGGADVFECSFDYSGNGGFNISGSTFTAPSGTMIVAPNSSGVFSNRSAGTFSANGGTFSYFIRNNENIGSGFTGANGFNNLTINVQGTSTRTLTVQGTTSVAGTLALESSSTIGLTINSNQINVSGGLDVSGNLASGGTGGTTIISLVGSGSQTITGNSANDPDGLLPNVTINQTGAGSVTISNRVNFGRDLTITSNGTITASAGSTVAFGGSTAAQISGATTLTNIDLVDFIANKTAVTLTIAAGLTPNIRITGVLTVPAGTLATNGKIIMRSTAANTSGQVGVVSGTITGNVTVQRFIPGSSGRKFRFLASPVTTSNGIDDNWQQQIHITGAGANGTVCPTLTANDNGFDRTTNNGASMFTFNEGTNAWASIATTTGVNLTPGVGYRVLVRGPRSQGCSLLDGTNPTPNDVTLSATGTLVTGTQTINITDGTGNGWNLIGNPFQAIIDWDAVGRTNAQAWYVTFNPTAGIGGVGAYGNYTVGGSGTNGTTRYIGPGQSFWVEATAGGTIAIEEADKAVTQTGAATVLFKTGNPSNLSIKVLDQNNFSDEILVGFNSSATKCKDNNIDIEKFQFTQNAGNLASYTSCDATRYSINTLPAININVIDTLYLHVRVPSNTSANYRISLDGLGIIDAQAKVYLHDNYLNINHDLRLNNVYNFATIANNAATQGANRFSILIGQNLAPLPVKLTSFIASRSENQTKLVWNTSLEVNSHLFIVERSIDAENYEEVGVIAAKGNSNTLSQYTWVDLNPAINENNYYRLKLVDKDGSFEYSAIQIVSYMDGLVQNTALVSSVYPIPAKDKISAKFSNDLKGNVTYGIFDITGNTVVAEQIVSADLYEELHITLPAQLNSGIYIMRLTDEYGNVQRVKFTKE